MKTEIKDVIFHQTRTKLRFKDRIKVLFGAEIICDSEIDVDNMVTPLGSRAIDTITFLKEDDDL